MSSNTAGSGQRTPLSTIFAFGAGSLPLSALGIAMAISVQPYFAQNLGVSLVDIALAFTWVRVMDMFVDFALAIVMDRTRTPIGRYRIWMIAGAPILMLGVYMLFMAPKGIDRNYLILWLLVYALGTSIVGLSRASWSTSVVTRYDQRSRFYGYLTLIGVIGTLIALGTPVVSGFFVKGANNVQLIGWTILVLTPFGIGVTALLVPERINVDAPRVRPPWHDYWDLAKRPEVLRLFFSSFSLTLGPGWMANLYLFYFVAARGFTEQSAYLLLICYVLAGVLGAPLIGWIGGRFGKHRTMIVATVLYSLGLCTVVIIPKADFLAGLPVMVWCGFMATGFDLMSSAMMADVGDQVRLEQGKERMALLFAATGLAGKLAAAGALIISYPLLQAVGYVPKLAGHNTPAAITGLQLVFIIGPIFWVTLGGICFLGWKLDARRHGEIRAALEARDAELIGAVRDASEGLLPGGLVRDGIG
ncbi:MAG TPA: MFS transporter [Caulobacteraceae bacterium]|nr:MFS transporter [Caulobacteraceae bacterium]